MADDKIGKPAERKEAASKLCRDRAAELSALREMMRRKYGDLSDSTAGIRADREARG